MMQPQAKPRIRLHATKMSPVETMIPSLQRLEFLNAANNKKDNLMTNKWKSSQTSPSAAAATRAAVVAGFVNRSNRLVTKTGSVTTHKTPVKNNCPPMVNKVSSSTIVKDTRSTAKLSHDKPDRTKRDAFSPPPPPPSTVPASASKIPRLKKIVSNSDLSTVDSTSSTNLSTSSKTNHPSLRSANSSRSTNVATPTHSLSPKRAPSQAPPKCLASRIKGSSKVLVASPPTNQGESLSQK